MMNKLLRYSFFISLSIALNIGIIFLITQVKTSDYTPVNNRLTDIELIKKINLDEKTDSNQRKKIVDKDNKKSISKIVQKKIPKIKPFKKDDNKELIIKKIVKQKKVKKPQKVVIELDETIKSKQISDNIKLLPKNKNNIINISSLTKINTLQSNKPNTNSKKDQIKKILKSPMVDTNALFNILQVDVKPKLIYSIKPLYPRFAQKRRIEGKVLLKFIVNKNGNVEKIKIIKSEPASFFDENSITALKQFKFSPGKISGQPVNTEVELPFRFKLKN